MREHLVLFNLNTALRSRQLVVDFNDLIADLPEFTFRKIDLILNFLAIAQPCGEVLQLEKNPGEISQNQAEYPPGNQKKNQKVKEKCLFDIQKVLNLNIVMGSDPHE